MLLKDVHPTIAEILEGKHDALLASFDQATKIRRQRKQAESGIRKGSRVRFVALAGKGLAGREGIVLKINQKTISVNVACAECGKISPVKSDGYYEAMTQEQLRESMANACPTCNDICDTWNVSPALVEAIPAAVAA